MKRIIFAVMILSSIAISQWSRGTGASANRVYLFRGTDSLLIENYIWNGSKLDTSHTQANVRTDWNNTFTGINSFIGDSRAYGTANYTMSVTGLSNWGRTESVTVQTRPVIMKMTSMYVSPSVSLINSTDYHMMDISLTSLGTKLNNKVNLYPFESTAQHGDTGTIGDAVAGYFQVNNNSSGTITNGIGLRFLLQNQHGGTVTNMKYVRFENPTNTGVINGGSAIYIENLTNITNGFGITNLSKSQLAGQTYVDTVRSYTEPARVIFNDSIKVVGDILGATATFTDTTRFSIPAYFANKIGWSTGTLARDFIQLSLNNFKMSANGNDVNWNGASLSPSSATNRDLGTYLLPWDSLYVKNEKIFGNSYRVGNDSTGGRGYVGSTLQIAGLAYTQNFIKADSGYILNERTTVPTFPTSNTQMINYMSGDKIVWIINAAGTPRYYYFDATLTADQQIKYSATAP